MLLDGRSGIGSIVSFLALLHLSAAFATIDHDVLLDWLQELGMDRTVLCWFSSRVDCSQC